MRGMIDTLKEAGPKGPIVNEPLGSCQTGANAAVNTTSPLGVAKRIEAVRMFPEEHRLRFPIPHLLFEIRLDGLAPVMPHEGCRTEADGIAEILQSPANIDIIPSGGIGWIKSPNLDECILAEGHVAAWDVLGGLIVEQNMCRGTGGCADAVRQPALLGGWQIRSADADIVRSPELQRHVGQPIGVRHRIRIDV